MEITTKHLRKILDYNPDTGVFTWKSPLKFAHSIRIGDRAGTYTSAGTRTITIARKQYLEHRLAWFYVYGSWPKKEIDHINRIKDDNRIENLREATRQQNSYNIGIFKNNKTGYKGVSKAPNGTYTATLRLGCFETPEEAAKVYEEAARKIHGDFFYK